MSRGSRTRSGAVLCVAVAVGLACSSDPEVVFRDNDAEARCGTGPACPSGFACNNDVCVVLGPGGSAGGGGESDAATSGGVSGTGIASGGSAGAGGRAGSPPGTGGVGGGPGGGRIQCGDRECSLGGGEICCAMYAPPLPANFECRASGGGCTVRYECDGDEDCASGVCCGTRGSTGEWSAFVCQSSCAGGALHVGCRSATNCQSGNVCCGTRTGGIFDAYTNVECSETCDGSNQTVLCGSASDCGGQSSCTQSTILPQGFSYCG